MLAPGWRWMSSTTAGWPWYQAATRLFSTPADHAADVGQPHRRAVAPGDHQVVVRRRRRPAGRWRPARIACRGPSKPPLAPLTLAAAIGGAHVLHRQPVGRQPRRIDAHPHRRAHVALHGHPADAVDLGQLRLQQRVGGVADPVDRDACRMSAPASGSARRPGSPSNRPADTAGVVGSVPAAALIAACTSCAALSMLRAS